MRDESWFGDICQRREWNLKILKIFFVVFFHEGRVLTAVVPAAPAAPFPVPAAASPRPPHAAAPHGPPAAVVAAAAAVAVASSHSHLQSFVVKFLESKMWRGRGSSRGMWEE